MVVSGIKDTRSVRQCCCVDWIPSRLRDPSPRTPGFTAGLHPQLDFSRDVPYIVQGSSLVPPITVHRDVTGAHEHERRPDSIRGT